MKYLWRSQIDFFSGTGLGKRHDVFGIEGVIPDRQEETSLRAFHLSEESS